MGKSYFLSMCVFERGGGGGGGVLMTWVSFTTDSMVVLIISLPLKDKYTFKLVSNYIKAPITAKSKQRGDKMDLKSILLKVWKLLQRDKSITF